MTGMDLLSMLLIIELRNEVMWLSYLRNRLRCVLLGSIVVMELGVTPRLHLLKATGPVER